MYNQVTLIGRLGNDPELRYTPTGIPVAAFRMVTNETWTKDGQKQEKSTWFRVTLWKADAENVVKYVSKGDKVMVVGRVEAPNAYTNKNGEAAASNEVTCSTIKYLEGTKNGDATAHIIIAEPEDDDPIPF